MEITREQVVAKLNKNLAVHFARADWVKTMLDTVFEYLEVTDNIEIKCNVLCLEIKIDENMPATYSKFLVSLLKDFSEDRDKILSRVKGMEGPENKLLILFNDKMFDPSLSVEEIIATTN